jgi:hypothetical protein
MEDAQHENIFLQGRIREMSKHMKFVGLFAVIYGALMCLTIIGAIFGIPYIISGLRLRESADSYMAYAEFNDSRQLMTAFEKQSSFFFIMKVFIIIGLVFLVLYAIFFASIFALLGSEFFDALDQY